MAVVLVATFVINLDTTIVNVAIPALGSQLHATTSGPAVDRRRLQPRLRRARSSPAARSATASAGEAPSPPASPCSPLGSALAAAVSDSTGSLIGWRVVMGAAAAFIFPTTLSIISQTFPDRASPRQGHRRLGRRHRRRRRGRPDRRRGAARALLVGQHLPRHGAGRRAHHDRRARCSSPPTDPDTGNPLDLRGLACPRWPSPASSTPSSRRPTAAGPAPRTLVGFAVAAAALRRPDRGRTPPSPPDARRAPVHQPALHRRQRRGHPGVLRPLRVHLPDHPVLPDHARLQRTRRRRAHPARRGCIAVSSGLGTVLAVRFGNKTRRRRRAGPRRRRLRLGRPRADRRPPPTRSSCCR